MASKCVQASAGSARPLDTGALLLVEFGMECRLGPASVHAMRRQRNPDPCRLAHVGSGLRTLSVYARSHPVALSANHATAAGSSVLRNTRLSSFGPAAS